MTDGSSRFRRKVTDASGALIALSALLYYQNVTGKLTCFIDDIGCEIHDRCNLQVASYII